jgi:hypothetical protein
MRNGIWLALFLLLVAVVIGIVERRSIGSREASLGPQQQTVLAKNDAGAIHQMEVALASHAALDSLATAAADSLRDPWVRIPGTAVPIWPRP